MRDLHGWFSSSMFKSTPSYRGARAPIAHQVHWQLLLDFLRDVVCVLGLPGHVKFWYWSSKDWVNWAMRFYVSITWPIFFVALFFCKKEVNNWLCAWIANTSLGNFLSQLFVAYSRSGSWLDLVILKIVSNLLSSMILYLGGDYSDVFFLLSDCNLF